jgi:hypothetical protein
MRTGNIVRLAFHPALLALLFVIPAFSQQRWERNYGGTEDDGGYSVQQTLDGGYVVAGYSYTSGDNTQVFLLKTNAFGDTLWSKTYGGAETEVGYSVQQTSDGGYIIAGYTTSLGNSEEVYLVKTNPSGDTLWTRNYGGTGWDRGYSVQQTSDGGYILAGYYLDLVNNGQVLLIKTNASGDTLWTRTYGGTSVDGGSSVQQTLDGGYIVAGYTRSFGNGIQVYLIKTNPSGDTIWTRTYGGTGWEEGYSVQQTSDTGYIIAGETDSYGNGVQVYLVKANASGDTLWTRAYGGVDGGIGYSVQQTSDGGFIVAGYTYSPSVGNQVYLVKTNGYGDTLWTKTYGGASDDWGHSVRQTSDGGYVVTGEATSFGNSYQVYVIKTDANGSSGVEDGEPSHLPPHTSRFTVLPNPFSSFATVPGHSSERFSLYDISGRRVGVYKGDRIGEGLRAGVYFVRKLDGGTPPVRIVKIR